MAQIRLTLKIAKDLKIKDLGSPKETINTLDDWFFDCLYVNRRKVAIITHGRSLLTVFIPYAEAGGSKNIISYFTKQMVGLLKEDQFYAAADKIQELFSEPPYFSKTVNKKVLGHMNDFKRMLPFYPEAVYSQDWARLAFLANDTPISYGGKISYPAKMFAQILIETLGDNVISLRRP